MCVLRCGKQVAVASAVQCRPAVASAVQTVWAAGKPCFAESFARVCLSMPAKGAMCRRCCAWWRKDELATVGCRRCIEGIRVKLTLEKVLPTCVGSMVFDHLWLANEFSLARARRAGYCAHDHRCRCGQCRGMPGSNRGRRRIVHRWRVLTLRTPEFESLGMGGGWMFLGVGRVSLGNEIGVPSKVTVSTAWPSECRDCQDCLPRAS